MFKQIIYLTMITLSLASQANENYLNSAEYKETVRMEFMCEKKQDNEKFNSILIIANIEQPEEGKSLMDYDDLYEHIIARFKHPGMMHQIKSADNGDNNVSDRNFEDAEKHFLEFCNQDVNLKKVKNNKLIKQMTNLGLYRMIYSRDREEKNTELAKVFSEMKNTRNDKERQSVKHFEEAKIYLKEQTQLKLDYGEEHKEVYLYFDKIQEEDAKLLKKYLDELDKETINIIIDNKIRETDFTGSDMEKYNFKGKKNGYQKNKHDRDYAYKKLFVKAKNLNTKNTDAIKMKKIIDKYQLQEINFTFDYE